MFRQCHMFVSCLFFHQLCNQSFRRLFCSRCTKDVDSGVLSPQPPDVSYLCVQRDVWMVSTARPPPAWRGRSRCTAALRWVRCFSVQRSTAACCRSWSARWPSLTTCDTSPATERKTGTPPTSSTSTLWPRYATCYPTPCATWWRYTEPEQMETKTN